MLERLPVLLILVGSDVAMMDGLATHGRCTAARAKRIGFVALLGLTRLLASL
ncbi:MAG: hypothetical protein QM713_06705 [Arachnia sp.]